MLTPVKVIYAIFEATTTQALYVFRILLPTETYTGLKFTNIFDTVAQLSIA
jgi:hypothetical protein